jgi:WD40 repeat protein
MSAIASRSTPPAGGDKQMEVMTLVGHERSFYYASDGRQVENENQFAAPISYFPDGKHMISTSSDKTIRLWDLEAGKEIEEARIVREQGVCAVGVSRDGHWIITAGGDFRDGSGELEAREVDTGIVKTFNGHSREVTCIDISLDSKQLASGSFDGAARIWSLDTGELVAGPFEHDDWNHWISVVRFSQNLKKLAVRGPGTLQLWDIQAQKLDRRVGNSSGREVVFFTPTPVFWTAKDRTIVTAFAFNTESRLSDTIYEFDSSTLETVGTPFEGHTHHVSGLALSFDYALLTSTSYFDGTIKLWAFESRQLLASFNQDGPKFLVLSPDSRQLAYMTHHGPPKIYICSIPLETLNSIWPTRQAPSV